MSSTADLLNRLRYFVQAEAETQYAALDRQSGGEKGAACTTQQKRRKSEPVIRLRQPARGLDFEDRRYRTLATR